MDDNPGTASYPLLPIGTVRSPLRSREECPHQGFEGAPEAEIAFDPTFAEGLEGLKPGAEILVLTWFHEARRDVLKVHPKNDPRNPLRGVFLTRSPDRPNPIGLHRVKVVALEGGRLRVRDLEALDGTPVLDVKPVLSCSDDA